MSATPQAPGVDGRRLAEAAFPERLASSLHELGPALAAAGADRALPLLLPVLEGSDFLPRVLAGRPGLVRWLAGSRGLETEKLASRYRREALAAVRTVAAGDRETLYRRLRRYKYREIARIMVRDLALGVALPVIGRELAHLADALIAAALASVWRTLEERYGAPEGQAGPAAEGGPSGFCVVGMGKLGGEDLNFSSDVDLVYLYRQDGQTAGGTSPPIPHVELFTKLAEGLTRALSSPTADGLCWRVDLNLRPQGRSGAIVLSLPAMNTYYEAFGRTWERAALLKARVVAGDAALGAELLRDLEPFVWRRTRDLTAVNELRELKAQIDLRAKASERDVKLGPGGIREVEFFVNALQLLEGGRNVPLRERNTMKALRKVEAAGLVSAADADALEEAYHLLRRVENRLQMVGERQLQDLPDQPAEQLRLARAMGQARWEDLLAQLSLHRAFVARAFSTLLGQTVAQDAPQDPALAVALDLDAPAEQRTQVLGQLGFFTPDRALAALERLSRVRNSPFAAGPTGALLGGVLLLAESLRTPDPDQALFLLAEFFAGLRSPQAHADLLASHPQLTRRLLNLFGQSDFLSRYFLRHPELLDGLAQDAFGEGEKAPARIREELGRRLTRQPDLESRLGELRRYKNEEVLRIGLHDIAGEIDVPQVAVQLSAIASAVLAESLAIAEAEQRERYGDPRSDEDLHALSVIGMGKLGGEELGYHSDLDLIFVYSGAGDAETTGGARGKLTHHEYFAKVVQRLISLLQMQLREGYLYRTDTRLRPSGNKGTLVVSQAAFYEHHTRSALWERQALVKARGVAGDRALFDVLRREVLDPLVYARALPDDAAQEVHRMRLRMEREVAQESREQLNPKTGHGGLVDVEFAVQYLQLLHGRNDPGFRQTNTLAALSALASAGHLSPADEKLLREGYLFHRRVENRLRLIHGHSLSHLPTQGRALWLLARRLDYVGPDAGSRFLADYRSYSERVRAAYARLLGVE